MLCRKGTPKMPGALVSGRRSVCANKGRGEEGWGRPRFISQVKATMRRAGDVTMAARRPTTGQAQLLAGVADSPSVGRRRARLDDDGVAAGTAGSGVDEASKTRKKSRGRRREGRPCRTLLFLVFRRQDKALPPRLEVALGGWRGGLKGRGRGRGRGRSLLGAGLLDGGSRGHDVSPVGLEPKL